MARPKHEPTDITRKQVEALASCGVPARKHGRSAQRTGKPHDPLRTPHGSAAPGAVRAYAEILEQMGGDPVLVRLSREQAVKMEQWQRAVRCKVADRAPD